MKKPARRFCSVLLILIVFSFCTILPPTTSAETAIQVLIDGKQLQMDVPPVIQQGRTLVPLRAIFEALGATVEWNAEDKSILAVKGDLTLKLTIGSTTSIKNGAQVTLDVPPTVIGGRTLVPARFVSESLGATVEWDGTNRIVKVTSAKEKATPVDILYLEGLAYLDAGKYELAADRFLAVLELDPVNVDAHNELAIALVNMGQYEMAIIGLNLAIQFDPTYVRSYYNRGVAFAKMGQDGKAILDYTKAIELDPKEPDAYANRGNAYFRLGSNEKAFADYNKAIELKPTDSVYYYNRASAYFELGQNEKAIADLTKAIELNPKYEWAYANRGNVYLNMEQYEKAIADCNKAIQLDPKDSLAYFTRGLAYAQLDQIDKAINDLKKAVEINPNFTKAKQALSILGVPGYDQVQNYV